MGELVLTDAKVLLGSYDQSGQHNALAFAFGAELRDATAFGAANRKYTPGLRTFSYTHEGLWIAGSGSIDEELFNNLGTADRILTAVPAGATEGNTAFFARVVAGDYSMGDRIGEVLPFSGGGQSSRGHGLIRGTLMSWRASEASTGNGTGRQLGAIATGQTIYAALHVLGVFDGADTLDVTVESDDNAGFTSAVTRLTFTQASAIGSEWKSLAGPITDDYWRVVWTIAGAAPAFDFAVSVGIQ